MWKNENFLWHQQAVLVQPDSEGLAERERFYDIVLRIASWEFRPQSAEADAEESEEAMRIYFSGSSGLIHVPEHLVAKRKPSVMLTFYDIKKSGTASRLKVFLKRKRNENKT